MLQVLFLLLGTSLHLLQLSNLLLVIFLFLEVYFLFKFKNDSCVFIFLIYTLIHLYVFVDFYWFSRQISFWSDFQNSKTMNNVLFIYYLFFVSFSFRLRKFNQIDFSSFISRFRKNSFFYFAFILLAYISMIYGIGGENVIQANGYAQSLDTNKSTLFEYSILFYLMSLLFIDRKGIIQTTISFVFTICFIVRSLIYGGRIEVLEIAMLNIFFWLVIPSLINWKHILLASVLGLIFFQVVGVLREDPTLLLGGDIFKDEIFVNLYSSFFSKGGIKMSTEGDVIQSSARMIGMVDEGIISFEKRIISLIGFLLSPLTYIIDMGELSNLSTYKQGVYYSGGGGGVFAYLFVWFSFWGPIFGGIFLSKVFNSIKIKSSKYWYIYFLAVFTTFPRWFSYNPIFFLKFCLIPVILVGFISLFRKLLNGAGN